MAHTVALGLTGGVASGKGEVAARLRHHGIPVLNLDEVGRRVTDEEPDLAPEIARLCGNEVLREGRLDRGALRQRLFADPRLRESLERLLHPRIWKRYESWAEDQREAGHRLWVCEAALLIEKGSAGRFDGLIVVLAPRDLRKKRLRERDGISEALAEQMLAAQTDDATRRAAATFLIDNGQSREALTAQVDALVKEFRGRGWI